MSEQIANTVSNQLNGAITDVATSVTLVDASSFPTTGDFRLKVDAELMLVTGVAGSVLTVTRGIEGTTNVAHSDGRAVKLVYTAAAIAAGSPGAELDYVEFTADSTITATTEGTASTVVTGSAVTYDGVEKIMLEFFCEAVRPDPAVAGQTVTLLFTDGGTALGQAQIQVPVTGSNLKVQAVVKRRLTPSAASHTYDVRAFVSSGTGLIKAGAGGAGLFLPGFLRITRI